MSLYYLLLNPANSVSITITLLNYIKLCLSLIDSLTIILWTNLTPQNLF